MTALQGGGEAGAKAELQGAQGTRADGKCQRQPQEVGEQGRGERREREVSCVCVCGQVPQYYWSGVGGSFVYMYVHGQTVPWQHSSGLSSLHVLVALVCQQCIELLWEKGEGGRPFMEDILSHCTCTYLCGVQYSCLRRPRQEFLCYAIIHNLRRALPARLLCEGDSNFSESHSVE